MSTSCSAYNCTNRHFKSTTIVFHRFPITDKELCKKWIVASKRDGFVPTSASYICSDHFTKDDYLFSNSKRLKQNSVPSVFNFPDHFLPSKLKRKAPIARPSQPLIHVNNDKHDLLCPSPSKKQCTYEAPTKEELKMKLEEKKKKIKILQQKVRRKQNKISTLTELISDLTSRKMINNDAASNLNENFSGLTFEVIKNHLFNKDREPRGRRHNDEAKKYALTLNFYSPRAYEYVRSVFALPHARSLTDWTSSVNCDAGLFQDVFIQLKNIVNENPTYADCSLLCDAMSIKENIFYSKFTGNYEGYINYGKDIVVADENVVAKEALVLMLVSHRGHWKYPVGYVLIDQIKADVLHSLLSRTLDLCILHDLLVRSVTMEGTSTNLRAMQLFGCKLGKSLQHIDGSFMYTWL